MKNTASKRDHTSHTPLKEDIFTHLDSIYRSARRTKNFALALKVIEVCIKAKQATSKHQSSMINIQEMSDEDLEKMLQTLQQG
jgi:hypothetical protein